MLSVRPSTRGPITYAFRSSMTADARKVSPKVVQPWNAAMVSNGMRAIHTPTLGTNVDQRAARPPLPGRRPANPGDGAHRTPLLFVQLDRSTAQTSTP